MASAVTFKGLREYRGGLKSLSDQEIAKVLKPVLKSTLNSVVVPKMKAEAKSANRWSPSRNRNRGKRGKKGPLAQKITTKQVKSRSMKKHGALVAYHVAPRAWYAGFVTGGAQPHGLLKGAKLRTGALQAESQKAPGWRNRWHPGIAQPNDFVVRTGASTEGVVWLRVQREVFVHFKRQARAK